MSPRDIPSDAKSDHPFLYFNRELSWLDFNWRVISQAADGRIPLLERVRFLAIAESNLDEFFRKRVGGLKRQREAGVRQLSPDGRTPDEQLALIRDAVTAMKLEMDEIWEKELRSGLQIEAGITIVPYSRLSRSECRRLDAYFRRVIRPLLRPVRMERGGGFPLISNLSLSLALVLRAGKDGEISFARIKIPVDHDRWVSLKEPGHFIPIESLVVRHAASFFPGHLVESVHSFRLTRNADLKRDEEEAEDLLQMISAELRERRVARVVRLEVERGTPEAVVRFLCEELRLGGEEVYRAGGLLDFSALASFTDVSRFAGVHRPDLLFEPWDPIVPPELRTARDGRKPNLFEILREGDLLVHHPYDSFTSSVQHFLEQAVEDPRVTGIRQTLYRTSKDSPIIHALIRGAEMGKDVQVLVEVTARFEEERNIARGRLLAEAGVKVSYGILGLKTHAKILLVVREEEDGRRLYSHIGTGNYNIQTAGLYTDIGFLTADPAVGRDLARVFAGLGGEVGEPEYEVLMVAPGGMRRDFERLIEREIQLSQEGKRGRIIAKMNALDDEPMIRALYRASSAGVKIDLIIRGHTRLRPGLPGVSENIRVFSIIGRFLEHDRIYFFENGGSPDVLIGSADWRRRNLEERVEVMVRIEDEGLRARLTEVLELALVDNRLAWELGPDGHYRRRQRAIGEAVFNYQEMLMRRAEERMSGDP